MEDKELSAFVFGYSGAIGNSIISALATEPRFVKVTLFGRRIIELTIQKSIADKADLKKFNQVVIDFEKLDEYSDKLKGYDVGFSALGGSLFMKKEAFKKIEYDYVLSIAKLASQNNCKHFHYTSGATVCENNLLFPITQCKFEMENIFRKNSGEVEFQRISIYRPCIVLTKAQHGGAAGKLIVGLFRVFDRRRKFSVEAEVLGKFMVQNCFTKLDQNTNNNKIIEVFSNSEIIAWKNNNKANTLIKQ